MHIYVFEMGMQEMELPDTLTVNEAALSNIAQKKSRRSVPGCTRGILKACLLQDAS